MSSLMIGARHLDGRPGAVWLEVTIVPEGAGPAISQKHYLRPTPKDAPLPGEFGWKEYYAPLAIEMVSGWAYATGDELRLQTNRVRAYGKRVSIAVQVDERDKVHRVYLLSNGTATVTAPPDTPQYTTDLTKRYTFVEVDMESYKIHGPYELKDHPVQERFIKEVVLEEIKN